VIDRHDVLRTAVLWERLPHPVQVVCRNATLAVEHTKLYHDRDKHAQILEWIRADAQHMDLRSAPMMRLRVATCDDGSWLALLQLHHIGMDGQSLWIVMAEVLALMQVRGASLPPAVPYRNHVAQALAYGRALNAEAFFRNQLGDIDESTAPFGLVDVRLDGTQVQETRCPIEPDLAHQLRAQARRHTVSAATLFHVAWALVVAKTSARDDVVYGTVLLGRMHGRAGTQRVVGMFINTLPLRVRLQNVGLKELVEHVQRDLVELLHYEQVSLASAQRCSSVSPGAPLFTSLLNYRHAAPDAGQTWGDVEGLEVAALRNGTNYPITVSVDDMGECFELTVQTDHRLDSHRVASYLQESLRGVAQALGATPHRHALTIPVVPPSERHAVVDKFNATYVPRSPQKLVHQLFEEQVRRTPANAAVVHGERSLTYVELEERCNRLARLLRSKGVRPDQPVGICMVRSLEMIAAVIAVLKAGGAYLPLDPSYPPERLQYMVAGAAPAVLLTHQSAKHMLPTTSAELVDVEQVLQGSVSPCAMSDVADDVQLQAKHLAYVIYTSGSTGRPKGTAMPHGPLVNLIEWQRDQFHSESPPRVLQFAALSFDVAFQEIFTTLCSGATLVLLNESVRKDPSALLELIEAQAITRLFVPPLMLHTLAEYLSSAPTPLPLRDVITAGEQLHISPQIVEMFNRLGACRLHNHYGPTETHVVTALTLAGDAQQWPTPPSIGKPIANSRIYILDKRLDPMPIGVSGEIYIGGAGVARGYLNQSELTAERFIADPFSAGPEARLYRTGDLGKWREDGTIEYLGRNDHQIKIRGYRVELGEIESQLALAAEVREAAVMVREDEPGQKRLVAYVTLGRRQPQDAMVKQMREHLASRLPPHMVPSAFVVLERLPTTPSGKLDRRRLPAPERDTYASQQFVPVEGAIEKVIAEIWQPLLGVARIGRTDHFFELGGHSISVMQAAARLHASLSIEVPIQFFFDFPTVQQLAAKLEEFRHQSLVERLARGDSDVERLLERVASMEEHEAQQLLRELITEERS
jgi:amino acid adenylation domain-containing protein